MSQNMKDSEIVRNLVVFFGLIAILGILSGILGLYIQNSEFRENVKAEYRENLDKNNYLLKTNLARSSFWMKLPIFKQNITIHYS